MDRDMGSERVDTGAPPNPAVTPEEVATQNPLAARFSFNLSVPPIEVRFVNAMVLEEYELWFLMASVFAAAAVGFLVACLQSAADSTPGPKLTLPFLLLTVLFIVLLAGAATRAVVLRKRIVRASRTYAMQAVGTATTPPENG